MHSPCTAFTMRCDYQVHSCLFAVRASASWLSMQCFSPTQKWSHTPLGLVTRTLEVRDFCPSFSPLLASENVASTCSIVPSRLSQCCVR